RRPLEDPRCHRADEHRAGRPCARRYRRRYRDPRASPRGGCARGGLRRGHRVRAGGRAATARSRPERADRHSGHPPGGRDPGQRRSAADRHAPRGLRARRRLHRRRTADPRSAGSARGRRRDPTGDCRLLRVSEAPAERVLRLKRMKRLATGLLVAMVVLFVVSSLLRPTYPALGIVEAFAEAAMIGALADWFAVTALFRHPLGLPIPHTAIVPNRKNEIGRALARFIRDHFLTREAIEGRLARADLVSRIGGWLEKERNARLLSRDASVALDWLMRAVDSD